MPRKRQAGAPLEAQGPRRGPHSAGDAGSAPGQGRSRMPRPAAKLRGAGPAITPTMKRRLLEHRPSSVLGQTLLRPPSPPGPGHLPPGPLPITAERRRHPEQPAGDAASPPRLVWARDAASPPRLVWARDAASPPRLVWARDAASPPRLVWARDAASPPHLVWARDKGGLKGE
ncbi:hypothetical protein AB1E19_009236 [Capra hircus]